MDKLQMAMRFAEIMLIEHFKGNGVYSRNGYKDEICEDAWVMADAMQAEADKHKVSIEEMMKDHVHDYLYGRVCACGKVKDVEEEWQPDWSQAPEWATHFFCEGDYERDDDCLNGYFAEDQRGISIDADISGFVGYGRVCSCETFDYQGNWQDSLRKRPQ